MTVAVKIIESTPSIYEGVVYDRDVTVELSDGTRFGMFDPDATVVDSLAGTEQDVIIGLLTKSADIEVIGQQMPRIVPNPDEPLGWRHTFIGRIIEQIPGTNMFDEPIARMILHVGDGTVQFILPLEEGTEFEPDEFVQVDAIRADIFAQSD